MTELPNKLRMYPFNTNAGVRYGIAASFAEEFTCTGNPAHQWAHCSDEAFANRVITLWNADLAPQSTPKAEAFRLCQNCNRLVPHKASSCSHCGTVVMTRRPDPVRTALTVLMDRVNEIKGYWTESLDNAMQQAELALRPGSSAPAGISVEPKIALQSIHPDNPPLTCVQFLEHARDSMDAADAELQAANKLASGMASLLLLDMIREVCVMASRIRAILSAAKDAEEKFNVYCEGDGSWLEDASKGVFSMDRGNAVAMTRAEAEKHADGAIYHVVPVGQAAAAHLQMGEGA